MGNGRSYRSAMACSIVHGGIERPAVSGGCKYHNRRLCDIPRCRSFSRAVVFRTYRPCFLYLAGTDSIAVLAGLDMESVCASSGSACSSGSLEPSHVLKAMGVSHEEANALVRFSLGRETTVEEIDHALGVLPGILGRCRR